MLMLCQRGLLKLPLQAEAMIYVLGNSAPPYSIGGFINQKERVMYHLHQDFRHSFSMLSQQALPNVSCVITSVASVLESWQQTYRLHVELHLVVQHE